MSAWIVSKEHVDLIVTAMVDENLIPLGMTPNDVGQELWCENYASVNHRYSEDDLADGYVWRRHDAPTIPCAPVGVLLKQIHCLEYQSCEHPRWETCRARGWLRSLEGNLMSYVPGYNDAPWGWEDMDVAS